jgi:cell division protein FtsI/penicillin-binding protein 2
MTVSVVDHNRFAAMERDLRSSEQLIPARRGDILDCVGRVLATDRPSFDVIAVPALLPITESTYEDFRYLREWAGGVPEERLKEVLENHKARLTGEETIKRIAGLTALTPEDVAGRLVQVLRSAAHQGNPYARLTLIADLPFPTWEVMKVQMEGAASSVRGIECVVGRRREYPYGRTAGHIVGYVREMSQADLESLKNHGVILSVHDEFKVKLVELLQDADPQVLKQVKAAAGGLPGDFSNIDDFIATLAANEDLDLGFLGPVGEFLQVVRRDCIVRGISAGEQLWLKKHPYLVDSRIGAAGVEARYNRMLSGVHGYQLVERTLWDKEKGEGEWRRYIEESEPVSGSDLKLTIDIEVQRMVEKAISSFDRPAAAVVMKLDGSVLALASNPVFDPGDFADGKTGDIETYLTSPAKPMISRAYQEQFPMGSVIKVIDATAGLMNGTLTPSTVYTCEGTMLFEGKEYTCTGSHGEIALQAALAHSCNIYFFRNALATGRDAFFDMAHAFGLGTATGIDLPSEAPGIFPERSDDGSYHVPDRELLFVSIGQGPMAVTPLQAARVMAAIASRGRLSRPFVAGHREAQFTSIANVNPEVFSTIEKGMTAAVHLPGGTAYEAFNERRGGGPAFCEEFPYILIAGKTGTAQHSTKRAGYMLDHSWFAGYAPAGAPEIAFAVIIEGAGHGGGAAAWSASEFLADYFRYTRKGAGK